MEIAMAHGNFAVTPSILERLCFVRFEVLTAAREKMVVFSVVAPFSLVEVHRRFRGACCLHHQGDETSVNFKPDCTAQQPKIQASSFCLLFSSVSTFFENPCSTAQIHRTAYLEQRRKCGRKIVHTKGFAPTFAVIIICKYTNWRLAVKSLCLFFESDNPL
jgi:hypothetical protein